MILSGRVEGYVTWSATIAGFLKCEFSCKRAKISTDIYSTPHSVTVEPELLCITSLFLSSYWYYHSLGQIPLRYPGR